MVKLTCIKTIGNFVTNVAVEILNANGGGDLLVKPSGGSAEWLHCDEAFDLFGEEYCNNTEISKLISNDYNKAMEQCKDLI